MILAEGGPKILSSSEYGLEGRVAERVFWKQMYVALMIIDLIILVDEDDNDCVPRILFVGLSGPLIALFRPRDRPLHRGQWQYAGPVALRRKSSIAFPIWVRLYHTQSRRGHVNTWLAGLLSPVVRASECRLSLAFRAVASWAEQDCRDVAPLRCNSADFAEVYMTQREFH